MIIESLIQDESKVTFDCAKATISRGSRIEIEDKFWAENEIQGAIRLGFCAIVGEPPVLPAVVAAAGPEKTVRFRNNFDSKLCFECIKDYADPGMLVRIPISKLDEPEVRNAIAAGWLLNEDNPELNPTIYTGAPLHLDELTTSDIDTSPQRTATVLPATILPGGVPAVRPTPKAAQSQIKAKRVSSTGEVDEEADTSDLYKESKVHVPKSTSQRKAPRAAPLIIEDVIDTEPNPDADFDFSDVFSAKQPKKK